VAGAAAAAEQEKADEWQIFPPGERVFTVAAVGAGRDDALVFRKAYQHHVQKAAEGEAE